MENPFFPKSNTEKPFSDLQLPWLLQVHEAPASPAVALGVYTISHRSGAMNVFSFSLQLVFQVYIDSLI